MHHRIIYTKRMPLDYVISGFAQFNILNSYAK